MRAAPLLFTGALLLAACGSSSSHPPATSLPPSATSSTSVTSSTSSPTSTSTAPPTTATPVPAPPRATTTSPAVPRALALSEPDNGKAVAAHVGETITVVLHSTYWQFNPPSSPSVVAPQGTTTVAPDMHGCVPGGGCGTVTMAYRAAAPGSSTISAHRDSCGEAMRCTGASGAWSVTVTVS